MIKITKINRESNDVRSLPGEPVCDLEICTCMKVELRPQGHSLGEEAARQRPGQDAAAAH